MILLASGLTHDVTAGASLSISCSVNADRTVPKPDLITNFLYHDVFVSHMCLLFQFSVCGFNISGGRQEVDVCISP